MTKLERHLHQSIFSQQLEAEAKIKKQAISIQIQRKKKEDMQMELDIKARLEKEVRESTDAFISLQKEKQRKHVQYIEAEARRILRYIYILLSLTHIYILSTIFIFASIVIDYIFIL
jgi:hypothetical protein